MNKTDLLVLLERRLGSRGAAVAALDAVLDEVQRAVAAGERVTLTGFGTFERADRPARTGRNPRTGEALAIAASAVPRFHPGAVLRSVVAGTTTLGPRPEPVVVAPRRVAAATGVATSALATSAPAAPAPVAPSSTSTDVPRAKGATKHGKASTTKAHKKADAKAHKKADKKVEAASAQVKAAKPEKKPKPVKKSGKKK